MMKEEKMSKPKRGEQTKCVIEYLKKWPERSNSWVKHDTNVNLDGRAIEGIRLTLEEMGKIPCFDKRKGRTGGWYSRKIPTEAWHKPILD